MMNDINIRPYRSEDRDMLRKLCCDVADRGSPIESLFPDREVAADLLTKYYTDYEPSSTFVAINNDGRMAGYVTGCMDNRRYGLVLFWLIIPAVLIKAFKRGVFFKSEVHRMVVQGMKNWRRLFTWRKTSFHSHQGHVHIGISSDFRGHQVGKRLMEALIEHARQSGIVELAASVHEGNTSACAFFEAMGFEVRERSPMIGIQEGKEGRYVALMFVKTVSSM